MELPKAVDIVLQLAKQGMIDRECSLILKDGASMVRNQNHASPWSLK